MTDFDKAQAETQAAAMSQMYYLVMGRSPAWSPTFGTDEAVDEVKDALTLLRKSADQSFHSTQSLRTALDHSEHMATFIKNQNAGYVFESLGEDMHGMRTAAGLAA